MSCVTLKLIYIKDKIEKYIIKSKTICSEQNKFFSSKSNKIFWVNLIFSFLIFFHISERKMTHNLPWFVGTCDHILHLFIGFNCSSLHFFKKKRFLCLYDSATELRSGYFSLCCSTSGHYKRNQQNGHANAMETQFFRTMKNTEFFTRLAILHNIFVTI